MQKQYKNTYQKLSRDISKSKVSPQVYFDAQNIRVMAFDRQSSGSVHNIKGNAYKTSIPKITFLGAVQGLGYKYSYSIDAITYDFYSDRYFGWNEFKSYPHGYAVIRDRIVFFSTDETGEPNGSTGAHWIYDTNTNQLRLIYLGIMNYSLKYPIDAFGNYENSNVQKVYWLDGFNYFRHMNIVDPDLATTPETNMNSIPAFNYETLELTEVIYSSSEFKSGKVAYAYSYVNRYGSETKLSPFTQYYPIGQSDSGLLNEQISNAVFKVRLNNPDQNFDYVRFYRIYLTLNSAVPVVELFDEEPVGTSPIEVIDDNSTTVSVTTIEQLAAKGGEPRIPYTMGVKDSRIFTANHKTSFFDVDFDSRAYRFDGLGVGAIWDRFGVYSQVSNVASGQPNSWFDINLEHDAINYSAYAETDSNADPTAKSELDLEPNDAFYNQFIYQSDASTIGAEGPYVKLGLKVSQIPINTYSNYTYYPDSTNSFVNPVNQDLIGLKRDEVYRIAIRFRNKYGQKSFPKWICDFRMPSPTEVPLVATNASNFNQLQLEFELKPNAIAMLQSQGAVGYEIVRVERTTDNMTVQCQGMLAPVIHNAVSVPELPEVRIPPLMGFFGETEFPNILSSDDILEQRPYDFQNSPKYPYCLAETNATIFNTYSPWYLEFRSPDLNQGVPPYGYFIAHTFVIVDHYGLILKAENPSAPTAVSGTNTGVPWRTDEDTHYALDMSVRMPTGFTNTFVNKPVHIKAHSNILNFDRIETVGSQLITGTTTQTIFNWFAYSFLGGKSVNSVSNHGLLFRSASDGATYNIGDQLGNLIGSYIPAQSTYKFMLLADFKRRLPNQYGGRTFADRSRNQYIESSAFNLINTSPVTVYGDTYTTMMRYQRSQVNPQYQNAFEAKSGSHIRSLYFLPCEMTVNDDLRIKSNIKFSANGSDQYWMTIDQFHQYNNVYHDQFNEVPAIARPLGYQFPEHYDNEFGYSDNKIPGEQYDSWTVFQPGNINYVDAIYGPVERIIINADRMYFFQHYAYGGWAINPRISVTGEQGSALEIGTGEVLHDYQYMSTDVGCQHKWSVSAGQYGVIWYDNLKKKIMQLAEGAKELNLLGINSWLQNTPSFENNPLLGNGVSSVFNMNINESYISFIHPDLKTTWIFSHLNGFSSRLTLEPQMWIRTYDKIYSVSYSDEGLTNNNIYLFNAGKRGEFNGQKFPAYITLIVNGDPDFVKMLTNLQWNSEAYDASGIEQSLKTITHIRVWNDYQDTGLVELTSKNSNRFLRDWKFTVPILKGRFAMRAQYHFVQLYFDSLEDLEIVLHDLVSSVKLQY